MAFPNDVNANQWNQDNLQMWSDSQVTDLDGVQLLPLEAKALHVIGTLVRIFDGVGYLLYCGPAPRPYANHYLYAYLLACTAIELLGRCQSGEQNPAQGTLRRGLRIVDLQTVTVNVFRDGEPDAYIYDEDRLVALRNLAAHGQGVASVHGQSHDVILHVELLDSFANKLATAFDCYYAALFEAADPGARGLLSAAAVEPVLHSHKSGQVYVSPIRYAYQQIYKPQRRPSQVLRNTDWQVYNPPRDRR
jgi:hypothetical protein